MCAMYVMCAILCIMCVICAVSRRDTVSNVEYLRCKVNCLRSNGPDKVPGQDRAWSNIFISVSKYYYNYCIL